MDDELKLEAVYYPAPVPSGAISLTAMGVIFDRIHFPNVYIPGSGFDVAALIKEIERIQAFDKHDYDSLFLLHALKVTLHAEILEDICVFTGENGQVFGGELKEAKPLVEALYETIHGPPKENFTPIFDTASHKSLPDSDEYIDYPGAYYYPANAILYSARTGIPLINDNPYLPIPAVPSESIENNSTLLSALLTMECIKLLLPEIRPLQPAELKELREELYKDLRGFRIAMLKLAKELNSGIKEGASMEDVQRHAQFLVETDVYPRILELKDLLEAPSKPWSTKLYEGVKGVPELIASSFSMPPNLVLAQALTKIAGIFVGVDKDRKDKEEMARRSGIYYLLKLTEKLKT